MTVRKKKMKSVTRCGTRLEQLENLALVIADNIDRCEDERSIPQLARQYRDTIKEIEEIKGVFNIDDEIGEILQERKAEGKSRTVRADRT